MRIKFLAQGNNGAFAGSRTHDWQASTDYESDALPTTRNCRISCAEYWSQSSLCEQKRYRFVLLTGRVFKIDETLHGKCRLSIPVVILSFVISVFAFLISTDNLQITSFVSYQSRARTCSPDSCVIWLFSFIAGNRRSLCRRHCSIFRYGLR